MTTKLRYCTLKTRITVKGVLTEDLRVGDARLHTGNVLSLAFYTDHSRFGRCVVYRDGEGEKIVLDTNVACVMPAPEPESKR